MCLPLCLALGAVAGAVLVAASGLLLGPAFRAAGDVLPWFALGGAMTAAYWLSGHQEVEGIEEEWRPFLQGMREAAQAVEEAGDLETARAAAERINDNCQGCHDLAGVTN